MATDNGRTNFTDLIRNLQQGNRYQDLSWSGSFNDYLNLVRENPKITRNAFQRMYDMVIEKGTSEYVDVKKEIVHYKFFDDEVNDGKDAVYGADIPLMKLVNVLRSAALGYGTEKRVILLHGPVGSAKSTICRQLKLGIERYCLNLSIQALYHSSRDAPALDVAVLSYQGEDRLFFQTRNGTPLRAGTRHPWIRRRATHTHAAGSYSRTLLL